MAEINMENISLYTPSNEVAKRLYSYMEKLWELNNNAYASREQLYKVAESAGIKKNQTFLALKELERVVNCIYFWDAKEKTVYYAIAPISPEEKIKMIEDQVWFEKL